MRLGASNKTVGERKDAILNATAKPLLEKMIKREIDIDGRPSSWVLSHCRTETVDEMD